MTEPSPAEVLCRPSARNPWKNAPSTRPKRATAIHPSRETGVAFLPAELAQKRSAMPAGMRRQEATRSGVVCGASCFMATMEVPQKKKGLTRRAVSRREERDVGVDGVLGRDGGDDDDDSVDVSVMMHSTSEPVPTHVSSSVGGLVCVLLERVFCCCCGEARGGRAWNSLGDRVDRVVVWRKGRCE